MQTHNDIYKVEKISAYVFEEEKILTLCWPNMILRENSPSSGLELGLVHNVQGLSGDRRGSRDLGFHPQTICQSLQCLLLEKLSKEHQAVLVSRPFIKTFRSFVVFQRLSRLTKRRRLEPLFEQGIISP